METKGYKEKCMRNNFRNESYRYSQWQDWKNKGYRARIQYGDSDAKRGKVIFPSSGPRARACSNFIRTEIRLKNPSFEFAKLQSIYLAIVRETLKECSFSRKITCSCISFSIFNLWLYWHSIEIETLWNTRFNNK